MAEIFNILGTSTSCGNIHCSYQHYQPGKIIDAGDWIFSCYIIWIMDNVIHAIFSGFNDCCSGNCYWEKWCICV